MNVLFDECMPLPLVEQLADLPHLFQHATRVGLTGLANVDSTCTQPLTSIYSLPTTVTSAT